MVKSLVRAKVLFYSPGRGGRPFVPIRDGYAPYIRADGLPEDMAIRVNGMPLNGTYETWYDVELELSYHTTLDYSPLVEGTAFRLIEGQKIVGEGVVTSSIFSQPVEPR
jgi:hypothetical protein